MKVKIILLTLMIIRAVNGATDPTTRIHGINPFPLDKFFDITDVNFLSRYKNWTLCNGNDESREGCCSCKEDCTQKMSCCADVLWYKKIYTNIAEYKKDLLAYTEPYKYHDCEKALPSEIDTKEAVHYVMINTCRKDRSTKERNLCENGGGSIVEKMPVNGSDGKIYKNHHCAKCFSVNDFRPLLSTKCLKSRDGSCEYGYENHENILCVEQYKAKGCTDPSNEYFALCKAFLGPLDLDIRNIFCWLCNNKNGKKDLVFRYAKPQRSGSECKRDNVPVPLSWSSLLNLKLKKPSKTSNQNYCQIKNLEDLYNGNCFFCPVGYYEMNKECHKLPTVHKPLGTSKASFDTCLMRNDVTLSVVDADDSMAIIKHILGRDNQLNMELELSETSSVKTKKHISEPTLFHALKEVREIVKNLGVYGVVYFGLTALPHEYIQDFDHSNFFPGSKICKTPVSMRENITFVQNCDVIYNGSLIQNSNLGLWIKITQKEILRLAYTCNEFFLSKACPFQVLSGNATVLKNNSILHKSISGNKTYKPSEYVPLENGKYGVCNGMNFKQTKGWMNSMSIVEGYVSVAGSLCSILCYISFFVIFVIFKEMQTIPGQCIFALCLSLFLGDGLFIIVNILHQYDIDDKVCVGIGVSMHFVLLLSQFWGVIIAFNIASNINSSVLISNTNQVKTMIKSGVVCLLSSVVIVVSGVLLRRYNIIDGSYKNQTVCALHGFYSRIYLYYTPLLVCGLLSIFVLALTIYGLRKHIRRSQAVLGVERNRFCVATLALKLVIISGLCEIIGLVNVAIESFSDDDLIGHSFFDVVYSILKSFRGVMLFVVYVCRKKFIQMYRERFLVVTQKIQIQNIENSAFDR